MVISARLTDFSVFSLHTHSASVMQSQAQCDNNSVKIPSLGHSRIPPLGTSRGGFRNFVQE